MGKTFDANKQLVEFAPPSALWDVKVKGGRTVEGLEIDSLLSQKFAACVSECQDAKTTAESGGCEEVISMGHRIDVWDPGGDYYSTSLFSSFFKIWDPRGSFAMLHWLFTSSP